MRRLNRMLFTGIFVVEILTATPAAVSYAASIYDAHVEQIALTADQKPKVRKIVRDSNRSMLSVFRKYGINPNAKPDLSKLMKASSELSVIQHRERAQLSRILNRSQLQQYDRLIAATSSRVQRAAK